MARRSGILTIVAAVLALSAATAAADVPLAQTVDATDVTDTAVTLRGTVNPNGTPTRVAFEYGTTTSTVSQTAPYDIDSGTSPVPISATLTGLQPKTNYVFRAVAWSLIDAGDRDEGHFLNFKTLKPPHLLVAQDATAITQTTATVNVQVNTQGSPTTVALTYSIAVGPMGAASGAVVTAGTQTASADGILSFPLTGLTPGARYRWQATSTSSLGSGIASGMFRTLPLVAVSRPAASARAIAYGSSATIYGQIPGQAGLAVTLQQQSFPYTDPFAPVNLTATTDAQGSYSFTVAPRISAAFGIAAPILVEPSQQNTIKVGVHPAMRLRLARKAHRNVLVQASYRPAVAGTATLYRDGAGVVAKAKAKLVSSLHIAVLRFARRRLRPGRYEVRLTPDARSGLVSVHSSTFRVR